MNIPLPGQRIFRSLVAMVLCFGVYELRGYRGMPFFSVIAALQCIQQYTRSMQPVARRRVVGTLLGAAWGLAAILVQLRFFRGVIPDEMLHYLIVCVLTAVVIWSTVLLNIRDMAYFTAVVFMSITMNHMSDANPFIYVYHRTLDTVIGVAVAELVNRVHLPRLRSTDTLYISGIHDTIFGTGSRISPYSKVELNRLIEDGCLFTVSTIQTPATIRELLPEVELKLPVIAADGTLLFDMQKRECLKAICLEEDLAHRLADYLKEADVGTFLCTIEHNLLTTRFGEMKNEAMKALYEQKRVSPYRNFAPIREGDFNRILYFLLVDREERIKELMERLRSEPWSVGLRMTVDRPQSHDGYLFLKLLPAEATQERMQRLLMEKLGLEKCVTFGADSACDVRIEYADKDRMVKELKRRFEPVDIRGWRNVFRFR